MDDYIIAGLIGISVFLVGFYYSCADKRIYQVFGGGVR